MDVLGLMIDNTERTASNGGTFQRLNPITNEVATTVAAATVEDAVEAANAAARAFPEWSRTGPGTRRKLLLAAADRLQARTDDFVAAMAAETGSTAIWAKFNVKLAATPADLEAWLQPLADAGSPRAMTLLGIMYENGLGVDADPVKALELYQKAADLGYPQAIQNMAVSYRNGGLGLTEDDVKAREYLAKGVALDFAPSMTELALMLRDGEGGPVDAALSVALFQRAVALGDSLGTAEYAYMLATGDGAEIDLPKARHLYEVAAAQGIDWAERDFAEMMELGEGGAINLDVALDFYRRAAAQGYGMSAFDIFEMYNANQEALADIKQEALAMCFYAEAQPPQWDGSEFDGKCDPALPDYTPEEIAAAREAAKTM